MRAPTHSSHIGQKQRPQQGAPPGTSQTKAMRSSTMTPIGDCLRRPKGRLAQLIAQTDYLTRLNRVFHAYLPPHLRDHAQITHQGEQAWTIQTESSAWATRLRYVLPTLRQQISEHLGQEIPRLQIRVQPTATEHGRHSTTPTATPTRRMHITKQSADLLAGAAENVNDQKLGAALLRLAERAQAAKQTQ